MDQIKAIKTKSETQNKIQIESHSEKLNGDHQDFLLLLAEFRLLAKKLKQR